MTDISPKGGSKRLWIAWERQRRSLNLSIRLGASPRILEDETLGLLRYPLSFFKTLFLLLMSRGALVFVQNPSMVLAAQACLFKGLFGYRLVVDRHSNFLLAHRGPLSARQRLFLFLSGFTLKHADLTLVTNREIADKVALAGGRSFILPDPYPELPLASVIQPGLEKEEGFPLVVFFVCSWAYDEPISVVIEACRKLGSEVKVYVSGRAGKGARPLLSQAPANMVFTGFLPDDDYFAMMAAADCVMALTTLPSTLLCAAYEAVSLGKPLILSDTGVLRGHFHAGAVYAKADAGDLADKILCMAQNLSRHRDEMREFRRTSGEEWEKKRLELETRLSLPSLASPANHN